MTLPPLRRPISMLRAFLDSGASGGVVLMAAAAAALAVANSPLGATYEAALHAYLGPLSVAHWINDGLMAVFFLLGRTRDQTRDARRPALDLVAAGQEQSADVCS